MTGGGNQFTPIADAAIHLGERFDAVSKAEGVPRDADRHDAIVRKESVTRDQIAAANLEDPGRARVLTQRSGARLPKIRFAAPR
jgi:hypothetical protein